MLEKSSDLAVSIRIQAVFVLAVLLMLAVVAAFGIHFWITLDRGLSGTPGDWGTFGDFVGGPTNPLVGLAALFVLTQAYLHQRRELRATSEARNQSRRLPFSRDGRGAILSNPFLHGPRSCLSPPSS